MPDAHFSPSPALDETVTVADGYVPVIDLALDRGAGRDRRAATARAIRQACETSGFLVVTGHGFPADRISGMYRAARQFFAQSAQVKAGVTRDPVDPLQRGFGGYERLEMYSATSLGEQPSDHDRFTEFPTLLAANRWPDLPGFREAYLAYYESAAELARDLMRLFALALELPEPWFDDKFDRHMTPLMVNYYPPQPSAPKQHEFRNDPHTDFGVVTVLYQDDAPGGLQVRHRTGEWIAVPPVAGSFVVNLGDLMARWTNGRWASTVHRVVNPPREQADRDRISIAFFYQPSPDAWIETIPTCRADVATTTPAAIRSGDYFLAKSRRAFLERRLGRRHM
ncbi:isopenicillin N synthase family dioxygenase [Micromonospora sp. NPDC050187]|uniref:isopenicillin N synthase family dioxygenase n=1 Tax=Micromonospora sp. NPDC050187 TaxID=3364277 RepID=UPI0037AA3821